MAYVASEAAATSSTRAGSGSVTERARAHASTTTGFQRSRPMVPPDGTDRVKPAQVAVIKQRKIRLPPFEHRFHGGAPRSGQPDVERDREPVLRPVPHRPWQQPASDGQEQRLELAACNLLLRRQRKNAVEDCFVEVGHAHLERCQHAGPVGLHEAVLTQIRTQVGAHQDVGVESAAVAARVPFPRLEVAIDVREAPVRRGQQLPHVLAKDGKLP